MENKEKSLDSRDQEEDKKMLYKVSSKLFHPTVISFLY